MAIKYELKIGTAWVQVANATLNFGIICQELLIRNNMSKEPSL